MMDGKQMLSDTEDAILYIIGIGAEGCQTLRYMQEQGLYEGVTLVALHRSQGGYLGTYRKKAVNV